MTFFQHSNILVQILHIDRKAIELILWYQALTADMMFPPVTTFSLSFCIR